MTEYIIAACAVLWIVGALLALGAVMRSSQISRREERGWGIDHGKEGGDWSQVQDFEESPTTWDHTVLQGVEGFDSETDAHGELPDGAVFNSAWPRPEQTFTEAPVGRQVQPWHSDWENRHPDCSRSDWELRIFHNTPDEQYLALHCGNCGKTVDPAEIINALIAHMEES